MTTLAITGASGFIGRHVLAALRPKAVKLVAHARTPRPEHKNLGNISWVHFDIHDPPDDAYGLLGHPDIVIHLAWEGLPNYMSPRHSEIELPAQYRFLSTLIGSGLKTLVVTGTCFEYGMQGGALKETSATAPVTPYGSAKDELRQKLEGLSETNSFDLRWLRVFYLYGEGQSTSSLYSSFHGAVERSEKSFDMSPGDQVRDFMTIESAAAAIARVALSIKTPSIINLCSGQPTTVRSLVEGWRSALGAEIDLNLGVLPYPAYEPQSFWGDNARLLKVLDRSSPK